MKQIKQFERGINKLLDRCFADFAHKSDADLVSIFATAKTEADKTKAIENFCATSVAGCAFAVLKFRGINVEIDPPKKL